MAGCKQGMTEGLMPRTTCRGLNASAGTRGGPSSLAGSYAGARASYAGSYAGGGGSYPQSEGSSPRASSVVSGMTGFESVGGPDTLSEVSRCATLAQACLLGAGCLPPLHAAAPAQLVGRTCGALHVQLSRMQCTRQQCS